MNLMNRKYEFIKKALIKHAFKYTYTKIKYVNAHMDVIITCTLHGDFTQSPKNHVYGSGCPICAYRYKRYGKKPYIKPTIIAYDICRYRSECGKCYF